MSKQDWSWKTGDPGKKERMEVYVDWLLTPSTERVPSSKRELAELMGVSTQTLRNYAKDPWLQGELVRRGRALNRVERASDVLDALYQQAVDTENARSVAAAKAWLDWVNQQVEPSLDTDIANMDLDELEALAESLAELRRAAERNSS